MSLSAQRMSEHVQDDGIVGKRRITGRRYSASKMRRRTHDEIHDELHLPLPDYGSLTGRSSERSSSNATRIRT